MNKHLFLALSCVWMGTEDMATEDMCMSISVEDE